MSGRGRDRWDVGCVDVWTDGCRGRKKGRTEREGEGCLEHDRCFFFHFLFLLLQIYHRAAVIHHTCLRLCCPSILLLPCCCPALPACV
ncbi:hypothetical protein P167DRAFT_109525 [Morchella conica CCBAS932]|uniref:Uncharacterized protein n=1 Tax=Morchella conica CCBAS932 TaxID=1392247 RepID=A0A3N4KS21_9PEZI|nr:hypothetical protein P167DRAFT_109525 [Morchella conica CCBAS932]